MWVDVVRLPDDDAEEEGDDDEDERTWSTSAVKNKRMKRWVGVGWGFLISVGFRIKMYFKHQT